MDKKYGEHSVAPQSHERNDGDPACLCGPVLCQGSPHLLWIGAYMNLDKEMIAKAPIIDARLNLKMTQEILDRAYLSYQIDTLKINNALVYQILSKVFTDMDAYIYVKHRKAMQDRQAVYFDTHKHFLSPNHVVKQATDAEGKQQNLRALQTMATVVWTMVSRSTTFSKALRDLSWEQQSMLSGPNQRSMD